MYILQHPGCNKSSISLGTRSSVCEGLVPRLVIYMGKKKLIRLCNKLNPVSDPLSL